MSEWIDIYKKSPEELKDVLVRENDGCCHVGYFSNKGKRFTVALPRDERDISYTSDFDLRNITHWQPLPPAPEKGEQG